MVILQFNAEKCKAMHIGNCHKSAYSTNHANTPQILESIVKQQMQSSSMVHRQFKDLDRVTIEKHLLTYLPRVSK